jgi:1-acyl-sn-glycerol-3-phosphate acyltransferase
MTEHHSDGLERILSPHALLGAIASDAWDGPEILGHVRPSPFYLLVGAVSRPFLTTLFRLRAEGVENLPANGGFVLAANHVSNFDPWPLGIPLWPQRYLRFMAKSELFWWPLGPLIRAGGAFKVRRGEGDVDAMNKAVELVRAGHVVVMFPHGTRQRKGLVKRHEPRAHTGAARIALAGGVPLVPAAISGTDRLRHLGPLRVRYGRPLALDGLDPRQATERLMAEIDRLGADL